MEGPPAGRSHVQRMARGDDHLRALVRERDPRLELAAQVKESHAAFRAMVVVRVGGRFGSIIKWSQGPLPIVRNLERLAGADVFEGIDTGPILAPADISESTALERADGNWELAISHLGGPCRPRSLAAERRSPRRARRTGGIGHAPYRHYRRPLRGKRSDSYSR